MAFTNITTIGHSVVGDHYEHVVSMVGPASYATGGELLSAADFKKLMPRIGGAPTVADIDAFIDESMLGASLYWRTLDRATSKIAVSTPAAQVTAATDLSGDTFRAVIKYGMKNK